MWSEHLGKLASVASGGWRVAPAWTLPEAPAGLREPVARMRRCRHVAGAGHLAPLETPHERKRLLLGLPGRE